MVKRILTLTILSFFSSLIITCSNNTGPSSRNHTELVNLYHDWRTFQSDVFTDGIPDYSEKRMKNQYNTFPLYHKRLLNFDTTGWSVSHQIDYRLVQAEMNGLKFDHEVIQPWKRFPGFYNTVWDYQSDTPAHEGTSHHGLIELWQYDYPLSSTDREKMAKALSVVPPFLLQAKENLTGNARDLWRGGIRKMKSQSNALKKLDEKTKDSSVELTFAIEEAKKATDDFIDWLEMMLPLKDGPSGIGKDNYNWYIKNVHFVPYTWKEIETMMRRELARSQSSLILEEHRNRNLPKLKPMASKREFDRRMNAAVTEYIKLLDESDIVTVEDYFDLAIRERVGEYSPKEPREFFSEVNYHDPMIMRTHSYHWIDLALMREKPHPSPIRSNPLLYNIWDNRSEGLATAMEEMMMHAGLFDNHPRSKELFHILTAQRAARALGDLYMHANEWDIDKAVQFTSKWTPRNWLREDGNTVIGEQFLYLQQPYYGTTYLTGKILIEWLLAERAMQLGDKFTLKGFMDEINTIGLIPATLMHWEMTGNPDFLDGHMDR